MFLAKAHECRQDKSIRTRVQAPGTLKRPASGLWDQCRWPSFTCFVCIHAYTQHPYCSYAWPFKGFLSFTGMTFLWSGYSLDTLAATEHFGPFQPSNSSVTVFQFAFFPASVPTVHIPVLPTHADYKFPSRTTPSSSRVSVWMLGPGSAGGLDWTHKAGSALMLWHQRGGSGGSSLRNVQAGGAEPVVLLWRDSS